MQHSAGNMAVNKHALKEDSNNQSIINGTGQKKYSMKLDRKEPTGERRCYSQTG